MEIDPPKYEWDLFVSHASEDQQVFVRPLANALAAAGYKVWYSEWELTLGDSLRATIDRGLAMSRYGVVVVSEAFIAKRWPKQELDGLVALEGSGAKRILPIWHEIDEQDIRRHSPILADRMAMRSSEALDHIVSEIRRAIDRTPRQAAPSKAVERRLIRDVADVHLGSRSLADPRSPTFGANDDVETLKPRRGRSESDPDLALPIVVFSLVPLTNNYHLNWDDVLTWSDEPHAAQHPLHNNDARPRGEGVILRLRQERDEPPTRYTYLSPEGYVEWGRTLGGSFAPDAPAIVRLGPLLWGAVHCMQFLDEMRARLDIRGDYQLVVSILNSRGTCLSHLGERWLEPWDRNFEYYRPTTEEPTIQYRRDLPARISRADAEAIALDIDVYLNRAWGSKEPRGHNHPGAVNASPLALPKAYESSDPWE